MSARLIRFIGNHDVNAEGKFLWEILAQLRRFGVGRIVTKGEWGRKWPDQPSYLRIQRVSPAMDRWLFNGSLWAQWVFRGKDLGVYEFSKDLNRSDWRLIHKHEEPAFTECKQPMSNFHLPATFPLPPLHVHMSKKAAQIRGKDWSDDKLRAPLTLSLDPEFQHLKEWIKQDEPVNKSTTIYEEIDQAQVLNLYGKELPYKVESWSTDPASYVPYFSATACKGKLPEAE